MNIRAQRQEIRSIGVSKINRIVRAAAHLEVLKPAFLEWSAGEVFICRKNGAYRYRFGDMSKTETPWSGLAKRLFATPAEFAFAAMVFAQEAPQEAALARPCTYTPPRSATRVNVLTIAA